MNLMRWWNGRRGGGAKTEESYISTSSMGGQAGTESLPSMAREIQRRKIEKQLLQVGSIDTIEIEPKCALGLGSPDLNSTLSFCLLLPALLMILMVSSWPSIPDVGPPLSSSEEEEEKEDDDDDRCPLLAIREFRR